MTGLGISNLPLPEDSFRPDLPGSFNYSVDLEREDDASAEDAIRAAKGRLAASNARNPRNRKAARSLAYKLDYASRGEDPPATLASRGYMRGQRIAVVGNLSKMLQNLPLRDDGKLDACTATILRADHEMLPAQFMATSPAEILNPLRMDLYRCGAKEANGAIFAGFHAEYEPQSGMIRSHGHLVILGGMVQVVSELRKLPAYSPIVRELEGITKKVPAIRITRITPEDLFAPLSYPLQSFIPSRWEGIIDGKWCRQKHKNRIIEPVHTQILMWLDQWRLEDLTMMIGLRVTKQGLIMTKQGP